MKEHEFRCQKCGKVWYVTDKDIRESKKLKYNIGNAKTQNWSLYHGKKWAKRNAQIAQMQMAYRDPYQCPDCGSRSIDKLADDIDATITDEMSYDEAIRTKRKIAGSDVSFGMRLLIILAIVFMPYLGIYLVLKKKPFSPRANRNCLIYCSAMTCLALFVAITAGNQKGTDNKQGTTQGEVVDSGVQDVQKNELVYDVSQFSKISGADLIAILGQPDSAEEGTCNGAFEIPCVYYDYNNAEGLGEVSFVLVNNSVVRFTSYNEYPYKDGKEILGEFGITEGENCVKAADTDAAQRYRCPADGIDDFRTELIDGDTFGYLQVTYDMSFYEEWYLPVSIGDRLNYMTSTEYTVKSLLKSPKSADFAGGNGWNFGQNQYYVAVQSYVDAQNSFGAEIRSEFTFIYFADTSTIAYAVFDGEVIADNGYTKTADIVSGLCDAQKQSEALSSASVG